MTTLCEARPRLARTRNSMLRARELRLGINELIGNVGRVRGLVRYVAVL